MGRAYFDLSPELLAGILLLPPGIKIIRAATVSDSPFPEAPIRCIIEGDELPENEPGDLLPQRAPTLRMIDGKPQFSGWSET